MSGLAPRSLFVWGRQDTLVPIAFMKHVEDCLPAAKHLELDCGHVPQLEAPRETHAAIKFFAEGRARWRPAPHPVQPSRGRPPGPRMPRLVQAARVTAQPYGFMVSRWRRYGDVFSSHFPIFGRVVYVADPAEIKRVFSRRPADLPRRRGQRTGAGRRARRALAAHARRGTRT